MIMEQPTTRFLTIQERQLLLSEHKKENDGKTKDRYKVILLLDQGWSYAKIAEALFLNGNTIRRYFEAYKEGGIDNLILLKYKGRPSQLSEEEEKQLKNHLKENLYISASKICSYIQKSFSVTYSVKGVVSLLHRLGFTYKKPKLVPGKADAEKQRAFLHEYDLLKKEQKKDEKILFMDGVHPQHNAKPAYGWIEKGKTKELKSNTGRERININGAINPETFEVISRQDDSINAQSTIELLEKIEKHYDQAPKITVICDNARYYKSKLVQEYLKTSKIDLKFLPPYSPNLNLISPNLLNIDFSKSCFTSKNKFFFWISIFEDIVEFHNNFFHQWNSSRSIIFSLSYKSYFIFEIDVRPFK
jgi:transposase